MPQLITVDSLGSIHGLDFKQKGLNLRQFGKAVIDRITLIEWHEEEQRWFIRWDGNRSFRNEKVWTALIIAATLNHGEEWRVSEIQPGLIVRRRRDKPDKPDIFCHFGTGDSALSVLYFDNYEDAVDIEVMVIQAARRQGNVIE